MTVRKVLAISKRGAECCANQRLLDAAGIGLFTTDNLEAAREVAANGVVGGVIVCRDSWTEAEREEIARALKGVQIPIVQCPGCVGYDEAGREPGSLEVLIPLTSFIERVSMRSRSCA